MPRHARTKGEFSIYHIIQRGNERKNLFKSDKDKLKFLHTLDKMKNKYNFLVYAYCLMDNHVHMIIDDNGKDISKIIKSMNVSYAYYFNNSYNRCGHLFQDRFKSELIYDDRYMLEASKYIHNNPVKAGMVKRPQDFRWSSYNIYTGKQKEFGEIVECNKVLGIISENRINAVRKYIEYTAKEEMEFEIMDVDENVDAVKRTNSSFIDSIGQAEDRIKLILKENNLSFELLLKNNEVRDKTIREIRKNSCLTLKQIGKIFGGISESRVSRILKNG